MAKKRQKLFIVDGNGLIYRAYYAFIKNPLINSKGANTSAVFGFFKLLMRLFKEYDPRYLTIVFDAKGPSFRNEIYKDYKANRQEMPEDLPSQIEAIKKILSSMGVYSIELEGYEGDDIIGTLADRLKQRYDVYIVTGDKDALQLIDDGVYILQMKRGISEMNLIGKENAKEVLGVLPSLIPDLFGLSGDAVDNIPGVKGIGEKTAKKLISQFGSLENIYNNIEAVKPERIKKLLLEQKDKAFLSKRLATIKRDVELNIDEEKLIFDKLCLNEAIPFLKEWELKSIIEDINSIIGKEGEGGDTLFGDILKSSSIKRKSKDYRLIDTEKKLYEVVDYLSNKKEFALDTETTGLKFYNSELVGISISADKDFGYFIYCYPDNRTSLSLEAIKSALSPFFSSSQYKKIGQNIKFDVLMLRAKGIEVKGIFFDTMIAGYLLSNERESLSLDTLAKKYLSYTTYTYKELTTVSGKRVKIQNVDLDKLTFYASEDADITWQLYLVLRDKIESEENIKKLFYEVEMPLCNVLIDMEWIGVLVDKDYLRELSVYYENELNKIQKKIFDIVGYVFNIHSTNELRKVLFEELGLPVIKKTHKEKLPSTDTEVLEELISYNEVIPLILKYREISKLKSTYTDALIKIINPYTGRIHTSYNQTKTATGRLSSYEPNLQNIPIRGEEGKKIRKAFIGEAGYKIYSFDYNQIELRLVAHFSQDENLLSAFRHNVDIHRRTASYVFGIPEDMVDDDLRRKAKAINFGIIYGLTEHGLAKQVRISRREAKKILENYFNTYTGIKMYIEKTIALARERGYVETIMGRRRYIPHINSRNRTIQKEAERIAINTPIQGSSADIIKKAMNEIWSYIQQNSLKSRIILQVHDELVFEIAEEEERFLPQKIKEIMENVVSLSIPLVVDFGSGNSWQEAH
jgi:DNA polymerase-1